MARRRDDVVARGLPYLVAERDDEIVGYAYAGAVSSAAGVPLHGRGLGLCSRRLRRQGIGRALLDALIVPCERARRAPDDRGHRRRRERRLDPPARGSGIRRARDCCTSVGWKFGRWLDVVLMQRALGPRRHATGAHDDAQACAASSARAAVTPLRIAASSVAGQLGVGVVAGEIQCADASNPAAGRRQARACRRRSRGVRRSPASTTGAEEPGHERGATGHRSRAASVSCAIFAPGASVLMTTDASPAGPSSSSRLNSHCPGAPSSLSIGVASRQRRRILEIGGGDGLVGERRDLCQRLRHRAGGRIGRQQAFELMRTDRDDGRRESLVGVARGDDDLVVRRRPRCRTVVPTRISPPRSVTNAAAASGNSVDRSTRGSSRSESRACARKREAHDIEKNLRRRGRDRRVQRGDAQRFPEQCDGRLRLIGEQRRRP